MPCRAGSCRHVTNGVITSCAPGVHLGCRGSVDNLHKQPLSWGFSVGDAGLDPATPTV